jgi:hypothetical protein
MMTEPKREVRAGLRGSRQRTFAARIRKADLEDQHAMANAIAVADPAGAWSCDLLSAVKRPLHLRATTVESTTGWVPSTVQALFRRMGFGGIDREG